MIRTIQQKLKTTDHGARATVANGEANGARQVTLSLATEDAYGMPSMLCHLKLSLTEARDLAERLLRSAAQAESEAMR